jgi:hypothetical protein
MHSQRKVKIGFRSLACYLILSASLRASRSVIKNVLWQPNDLQNGSVIFFGVELNHKASRVAGKLLGKDIVPSKRWSSVADRSKNLRS